jgi:hypothetical protein
MPLRPRIDPALDKVTRPLTGSNEPLESFPPTTRSDRGVHTLGSFAPVDASILVNAGAALGVQGRVPHPACCTAIAMPAAAYLKPHTTSAASTLRHS